MGTQRRIKMEFKKREFQFTDSNPWEKHVVLRKMELETLCKAWKQYDCNSQTWIETIALNYNVSNHAFLFLTVDVPTVSYVQFFFPDTVSIT